MFKQQGKQLIYCTQRKELGLHVCVPRVAKHVQYSIFYTVHNAKNWDYMLVWHVWRNMYILIRLVISSSTKTLFSPVDDLVDLPYASCRRSCRHTICFL